MLKQEIVQLLKSWDEADDLIGHQEDYEKIADQILDVMRKSLPEEKEVEHKLKCKMCSPNCGYNQALDDIKNLL